MKNLFKEAHKMAREIKAKYPEVDYKLQFGLCLSYLHENKEETEMMEFDFETRYDNLPELEGTEKQVKWAKGIRIELINVEVEKLGRMYFYQAGLYKMTKEELIELARTNGCPEEKLEESINGLEKPRAEYEAQVAKIQQIRTITSSKWFIENR